MRQDRGETAPPVQAAPRTGRYGARLRRWWERFVDFDERLYRRMRLSRPMVMLAFILVCICCSVVAIVTWMLRPSGLLAIAGGFLISLAATTAIFRWRLRQMLLEQRRNDGQCLSCGYDLRESPLRCPECGRSPRDDNFDEGDDADWS